ncbi:MAG: hypothetical protein H0U52_06840 [Chloroflexi bacterium]|nr:hypothetical protein [Chloroflexota bacterium]
MTEPNGVQPSDSMGNLEDLATEAGITAPTSVDAWSGKGRRFAQASSQALIADDRSSLGTLLQRDVTIQAILSLTLTGASGALPLIVRGTESGSASEHYAYGLELEQQALFAGFVEVRWFWADAAGGLHTQLPGVFKHPGDDQFFLLTATRRWETPTRVVVRYYVNADIIAEIVSTNGDIAGGTLGHTTVGGTKRAGAWTTFFNGVIDEIVVSDYEMSAEQVRETYRTLTEYQPAGLDMFVGLIPPGIQWAKDLGNNVGKFVRISGAALGFGVAAASQLRALWLPDAATVEQIARWENVLGLLPRARESLDVRRARVISYLSRDEGFSPPPLREALSGPFALGSEDVKLLEYTNRVDDDFSVIDTAEKWIVGGPGVWSSVGAKLHVALAAGADVRWDQQRLGSHIRMPLDLGRPGLGEPYVSAKLSAYALPQNTGVGLLLHNRRTDNTIWYGVFNNAGVNQLGYRTRVNGVLGVFTVLETPAAAAYWLRLEPTPVAMFGIRKRFSWSTLGPSTGFATQDVIISVVNMEWAGFAIFGTQAVTVGALSADWDDMVTFCPSGVRPFHWYAFRNPALAGAPDMLGAQLLVDKVKPAHTYAAVTQSESVLCDDPRDGLCDRGPLGNW